MTTNPLTIGGPSLPRLALVGLLVGALPGGGPAVAATSPGQVDPSFHPTLDGRVTHLVKQPDGKVLVAGLFSTINGVAQPLLARINPEGAVDLSFRPQLSGDISALAVGQDGHIVIAGNFSTVNGSTRRFIARLQPDGTLDGTFDAGAGLAVAPPGYSAAFVRSLVVQNDHKVVIGGAMTLIHGVTNRALARLNADGSLDSGFNTGGGLSVPGSRPEVYQMIQQGDGLLVGGTFEQYRGVRAPGVVRILEGGEPDTNFAARLPLTVAAVYDLEIVADGQLLVVTPWAVGRKGAVRLNADGTLDPRFDPGDALPVGIVLQAGPGQPDGRVYIHSYLSHELLRLNLDGSVDPGFRRSPGFQTGLGAAILAEDGRLLVGGTFTTAQGLAQPYLARVETGLGPPAPDTIELAGVPAFVSEEAGSVRFSARRSGLGQGPATVRYRVLSGRAQAGQDFAPATDTLEWAAGDMTDQSFSLALLDDPLVEGDEDFIVELFEPVGAVLGSGSSAGVTLRDNECPANALDGNFTATLTTSGTFPSAYALAVLPDDRILVGGSFTAVQGQPTGVARLTAEGALDPGFRAEIAGRVDALAPLPDERVLIAGSFNRVNETAVRNLARLRTDGSPDPDFVPALPEGSWLTALALEPGGSAVVGGAYLPGSGSSGVFVRRVLANGALDPAFVPPPLGVGGVRAVRLQHDGKILIVAQTYDGVPGLVRLQTNGLIDPSFRQPSSLAGYTMTALALLADGRMIVAAAAPALSESTVLRLFADGSVDPGFQTVHPRGVGYASLVHAILVEANGSIVLAGSFQSVDGTPASGLARLDATGHLDGSLAGQGITHDSGLIYTLAGQSGGAVIAGGMFTEFNNLPCSGLVRVLPIPSSGNTVEFTAAHFVAGEADGTATITVRRCGDSSRPINARLMVAGGSATAGLDFVRPPNQIHFRALEVTKTIELELLDDAMREPDETIELRLERVSDGALIGPQSVTTVTVLEDDLAPSNVDPLFRLRQRFLALQRDGKLLATSFNFLFRLDPALPTDEIIAIDPGFYAPPLAAPGGRSDVARVVLQPDGKILLGGFFTSPGPGFARLLPDGQLDEAFMTNVRGRITSPREGVHGFAVQRDGKILLINASSPASEGVTRLHPGGQVDTAFRPRVAFNPVSGFGGALAAAVALQPDGRILIGGAIVSVNGTRRDGLARLHADGSLDEQFAPVVTGGGLTTGGVKSIAVQPDGRILIGGDFAFVNGVALRNLARLNPDGSLDAAFGMGEGADGFVYALVVEVDGGIMVGGSFAHLHGTRRNAVGRLNSDGSIDVSVAPVLPPYSQVLALGHARDGSTLLGGQFCDAPPPDCDDDDNCDDSGCVNTLRLLPERRPRVVRLGQVADDQVQLQLRCLPGQTCVLQASSDLIHWTSLSTNLAGGELMECLDAKTPGWPQRFYRVLVQGE